MANEYIDLNRVKEKYARSSDVELSMLLNESNSLTHEAFILLKRECKRRNLDSEKVTKADELRVEAGKEKIKANIEKEYKSFAISIWKYAFNQKYNKVSDEEIQYGLLDKGLTVEGALFITENLEGFTRHMIANINSQILYRLVYLVAVCAILYFNSQGEVNGATLVFYGGMVLFALILLIRGLGLKDRYGTILGNIEEDYSL